MQNRTPAMRLLQTAELWGIAICYAATWALQTRCLYIYESLHGTYCWSCSDNCSRAGNCAVINDQTRFWCKTYASSIMAGHVGSFHRQNEQAAICLQRYVICKAPTPAAPACGLRTCLWFILCHQHLWISPLLLSFQTFAVEQRAC